MWLQSGVWYYFARSSKWKHQNARKELESHRKSNRIHHTVVVFLLLLMSISKHFCFKLYEFSQPGFCPAGSSSKISMDPIGYLYVPNSCLTKSKPIRFYFFFISRKIVHLKNFLMSNPLEECKLHIALHGCVQQRKKIGNIFAANTGYNQVADLNDFVILYPQAIDNGSLNNRESSTFRVLSLSSFKMKIFSKIFKIFSENSLL